MTGDFINFGVVLTFGGKSRKVKIQILSTRSITVNPAPTSLREGICCPTRSGIARQATAATRLSGATPIIWRFMNLFNDMHYRVSPCT